MSSRAAGQLPYKSQIDGTVTRVYTKVGRFADDTEDKSPCS